MEGDDTRTCPKCSGAMEPGYLVERRPGAEQQKWVPGAPQYGKWTEMLKVPWDDVLTVATFACRECGYLESYVERPR